MFSRLICDQPRVWLRRRRHNRRGFRGWLQGNPGERDRYAAAKRETASRANATGEHVMQCSARKQQVIREIYDRAFVAAGLLHK